MLKNLLVQTEELMKKTIEKTKYEFSKIRPTKADLSVLQDIKIEYQNTYLPLNQVATVTTPEPKTIDIRPWDASLLQVIEKKIYEAKLDLTPINNGKSIKLKIPPLTQERKNEIIKHLHKIAEEFRVSIRNERRILTDNIKKMEKEKKISQDDKYKLEKEVQKMTENYIKKIDEILKNKEKEITEG